MTRHPRSPRHCSCRHLRQCTQTQREHPCTCSRRRSRQKPCFRRHHRRHRRAPHTSHCPCWHFHRSCRPQGWCNQTPRASRIRAEFHRRSRPRPFGRAPCQKNLLPCNCHPRRTASKRRHSTHRHTRRSARRCSSLASSIAQRRLPSLLQNTLRHPQKQPRSLQAPTPTPLLRASSRSRSSTRSPHKGTHMTHRRSSQGDQSSRLRCRMRRRQRCTQEQGCRRQVLKP